MGDTAANTMSYLKEGSYVIIDGLVKNKEHNGRRGQIVAHIPATGRWRVDLFDGGSSICVKKTNIIDVAVYAQVLHVYANSMHRSYIYMRKQKYSMLLLTSSVGRTYSVISAFLHEATHHNYAMY